MSPTQRPDKAVRQPRLTLETGQKGRIGVLRDLRQIQLSVPDKYFFVNKYRGRSGAGKQQAGGFLAGLTRRGGKKTSGLDIARATEMVKVFHNSFQIKVGSGGPGKTTGVEVMSVSAMNDYRKAVKEAALAKNADFRWRALEAVVRFIDLKNSGIVRDKMLIQQDCLRNIGEALHEDGGLSMFHATWFLTVYRDYLTGFRMFRHGEVENIERNGGKEGRAILKQMLRRQLEIPFYLQLIDEKHPDIKQLANYARNVHIKRSRHGQKGCMRHDIREIFLDKTRSSDGSQARGRGLNEISIVMAYAMAMTRMPMMYEVVEFIKSAIPGLTTETDLYRRKITIAQKSVLLDIARAMYLGDGADDAGRKLYQLAGAVYRLCVDVISEHRLAAKSLESAIFAFPLMKQAALLIIHRKTFMQKPDIYADMLKRAVEFLQPVKNAANSADPTLIKTAGYAGLYEEKLRAIEHQLRNLPNKERPF